MSTKCPHKKEKRASACGTNPLILLLLLVRLAGIEPTTPWFVAKYSIQLSYSREAKDYITSKTKLERAATLTLTFRLVKVLAGLINLLPQRAALLGR